MPSPLCRRTAAFVTLILLVSLLLVGAAGRPAGASNTSDELAFFNATNQARASAGLSQLSPDPLAALVARSWSQSMAASGSLQHNPNLAGAISAYVTNSWTRLGENIGVGGDVNALQNAFMNSPPHKANVLGDYNRVGIGVARDASGRIWVTLDFIKGPPLSSNLSPVGNLDGLTSDLNGVHLWGWAIDPNTTSPLPVHLYADGVWTTQVTSSDNRPDVGGAFPGYGAAHGFSARLSLGEGWHSVCAYAIDSSGNGPNPVLGCRFVFVNRGPVGNLDGLQLRPGGVLAYGWAIDPDTAASIDVHAYDGALWAGAQNASVNRPDIGAAFPNYGSSHGFSTYVGLRPGVQTVCVYGLNRIGPEANAAAGCGTVAWSGNPFGNLDQVVRTTGNNVRIYGWSIDPDSASSTAVHVYVDGGWGGALSAIGVRNDVGGAFPGFGSAHGFDVTMKLSAGTHTVCAYGINAAGAGTNPALGCRSVSV